MNTPTRWAAAGSSWTYSDDLITWTDFDGPWTPGGGITSGPIIWWPVFNLWVTPGTGPTIYTSPDLIAWTAHSSPLAGHLAVVGDRLIVTGFVESPDIAYSDDGGVTWTTLDSPYAGHCEFFWLAVDGDTVVAAVALPSDSGLGILTSTDRGDTWTQGVVGDTTGILNIGVCKSVIHTETGWLACPDSGASYSPDESNSGLLLYTSDDALTWDFTVPQMNVGFAAGDGRGFATVGALGGRWITQMLLRFSAPIYTSDDGGASWDLHGSVTELGSPPLEAAGQLVAPTFGDDGRLFSSTDGITWTDRHTMTALGGLPTVALSVAYGDAVRPPQRQFPRDDGLGISTRRSWPPNISQQHGLRRGTVNTYQ